MAVMLSCPTLVRQRYKARARRLGIRFATQDFANLGVRQHLGETVRAEQEFVIDAQSKAVSFCLHSRFRSTEDVGDDVPESVHTCFGHVELAAAYRVCDHSMIPGELT